MFVQNNRRRWWVSRARDGRRRQSSKLSLMTLKIALDYLMEILNK
jgi:hypothetical protein